jgi:uncharacterized protein (TIGR02266 family)
MNSERNYRLDAAIEVTWTSESNFYQGFSENISEGGVFIATYEYGNLGDEISFSIRLSGMDEAISLRGIVRWVRVYNPKVEEMMPGMGLQFIELPEVALTGIRAFVADRTPLFYAD